MRRIFIILLLTIYFIACRPPNKDDVKSSDEPIGCNISNKNEIVYEKKEFQLLSVTEMENFAESSNVGNMAIFHCDSILSISIDGDFTENLFGLTNNLKWNSFLNAKYRVENISYSHTEEFPNPIAMKEILFGNSFIVLTIDNELIDVTAANIVDSLRFEYNITIGMSKDDFFSVLSSKSDEYSFEKINFIQSGNTLGDIEQTFYFKDQKLAEITQKTSAFWSEPVFEREKNKRLLSINK